MKSYRIHHIALFLGFVSAILMVSCNSSTQWNGLEFYRVEKMEKLSESPIDKESAMEETKAALPHENMEREMDVKVDMQFLTTDNDANETVCQLINGQLIELLLKQSSELTVDEAVAQYIEDVKNEFHGDEVADVYRDHLTGRAEYGTDNIINYRLVEDVFTGGAHPCTVTTLLRFNALTGAFIALENIFPVEKQDKLKELLLNKLMKNNQAHSMGDLHKKGILEMTEMFISNNFALREDSIEFYYNEYDIAPYAAGACTLCLSYEEAKDVMEVQKENP